MTLRKVFSFTPKLGQQYLWPQKPITGIIPEEWGVQLAPAAEEPPLVSEPKEAPPLQEAPIPQEVGDVVPTAEYVGYDYAPPAYNYGITFGSPLLYPLTYSGYSWPLPPSPRTPIPVDTRTCPEKEPVVKEESVFIEEDEIDLIPWIGLGAVGLITVILI